MSRRVALVVCALLASGDCRAFGFHSIRVFAPFPLFDFVDYSHLTAGAGSDLNHTIEVSRPGFLVIRGAGWHPSIAYAVSVRKADDYDLPEDIAVKVKRCSLFWPHPPSPGHGGPHGDFAPDDMGLEYMAPPEIASQSMAHCSGAEEVVVGDFDVELFQGAGDGLHLIFLTLENASISTLVPDHYNANLVFSAAKLP